MPKPENTPTPKARAYKHLDEDRQDAIRTSLAPAEAPSRSVESLEEEHFAHTVLWDKAEAEGDEQAMDEAAKNLAILDQAIKDAEKK